MSFESIRQLGMRSPYVDSWFFPPAVRETAKMAVRRNKWTLGLPGAESLNTKGQVHGNKPSLGVFAKGEALYILDLWAQWVSKCICLWDHWSKWSAGLHITFVSRDQLFHNPNHVPLIWKCPPQGNSRRCTQKQPPFSVTLVYWKQNRSYILEDSKIITSKVIHLGPHTV